MQVLLISLLFISSLSCVSVSGDGNLDHKGRHNPLISVIRTILPKRLGSIYYHTLYDTTRVASDCQPNCPQMNIWQYQYLGHISPMPISTQKAFWKNPKEARILAFSLFGTNPIYYKGLLDFLRSFQYIKKINHITEAVWGFDSFTPRVYVPKRYPVGPLKNTPLEGELEEYQLKALLEAGCEIVFVDNGLKKASKDATFWRFMIAAESMPEGQKVRYLIRDADWFMTATEAFAVGEWMASDLRYHRAHLQEICLGPLTASWWGGSHIGKGDFADLKEFITFFPYRMQYGDDELFLRDIMWPRMKESGSILTHVLNRNWISYMMNPYVGSCEEPTKRYCNAINPENQCIDIELPSDLKHAGHHLFLRGGLAELINEPTYFDMKLDSERGKKVKEAFMVY